MDRIKILSLYFLVSLSYLNICGQEFGNYISNGSFEDWTDCNQPNFLYKVKGWGAVDSISQTGIPFSYCNGRVPNQSNTIYQLPKTGKAFLGSTFFVKAPHPQPTRYYIKNRLRAPLKSGNTYCVKFYVNIMGMSTCGNDGFGIYFGDNSIDTITKCLSPLSYLIPQIKCPTGVPAADTLGWTAITGTFVASGNEKYAIIGVFPPDALIDTALTNPFNLPYVFTDACIDDVSCIPFNLQAYAGRDTMIYLGDSIFIGRQPDFVLDTACIWYKLPNMNTAIDTISGLWVKPTVTSTYAVRQELDCSSVKWDTVVVRINTNLVDIDNLKALSGDITLFPNPSASNLKITIGMQTYADFSSYEIVNALGQIIRKNELHENTVDINTQDFDSGLYELHLHTKYGTVTKKFLKTAD